MKTWIPSIILIILLILLVAATRVYVGGPDGLEVVWKGELGFSDTVVNVIDYADLPRQEVAKHSESLLSQMEDMGLFPNEAQPKRKHRIKKNSEIKDTQDKSNSSAAAGTNAASTGTNTASTGTNTASTDSGSASSGTTTDSDISATHPASSGTAASSGAE